MSLKTVISGSFIFLLVYSVAVMLRAEQVAMLLFSLSPLVIIYMAHKILKDLEPHSGATFDEKFYEDFDYTRNK